MKLQLQLILCSILNAQYLNSDVKNDYLPMDSCLGHHYPPLNHSATVWGIKYSVASNEFYAEDLDKWRLLPKIL